MQWSVDDQPGRIRVADEIADVYPAGAKQFVDDGLLAFLDGILAETALPPQLLQLEVTESMVMKNVEHAASIMREISNRGIQLAIDDFGTGYSSMSLMKHLPIDAIKIDRCFVQDIAGSTQDRAISAAIIALGRALGLTVVAEGVETAEQDAILKGYCCDQFQGFLFSRPVAPEQIGHLLSIGGSLAHPQDAPPLVPSGGNAISLSADH